MSGSARSVDVATGSDSPALFAVEGTVGRITLNRPSAINAVNQAVVDVVAPVLKKWASDDRITALVLDGAGDRGFCAGGDIRAIYEDARDGGGRESIDFWRDEYRMDAAVARFPKPVVSILDGIVMGGGVGIGGHAAHRVVTETSVVGMPEVGIGLIPDVGGTYLLARAPGQLGVHIALTAGRMDAADAIVAGFADYYLSRAGIPALIDRIVDDGVERALRATIETPPPSKLEAARSWIDECYSAGTVPEILDRLRSHPSPEAAVAAKAISAGSPTSAIVSLRAIRAVRTATATLEQAINMEFALVSRAVREPDLVEGIRAQIIDKDRNPRWNPATLSEVDPGIVDSWFVRAPNPPFPEAPDFTYAPPVRQLT